jgi:hypothetical protein
MNLQALLIVEMVLTWLLLCLFFRRKEFCTSESELAAEIDSNGNLLCNRRRCEWSDQQTWWRHFSSVDVAPRKRSCTFLSNIILGQLTENNLRKLRIRSNARSAASLFSSRTKQGREVYIGVSPGGRGRRTTPFGKNLLKLTARNFWENDPPFKILVTPWISIWTTRMIHALKRLVFSKDLHCATGRTM